MALHDQFLAVRDDLRSCLLERETTIDNALLALLTGEHMVIFGPPGTGKSMLVRALCSRIVGATYFEKAMSPVTTPEDLYGPVDLIRLADHGEWVRRDTGSMTRADIVFLDEITRSNEAIRDTLLVAANERLQQVVGFTPQPLPLLSLFSAANHAFDEASEAFSSRFLLREVVTPLQDPANFRTLFMGRLPDWRQINASVTLDELRQAQSEIMAVKGTGEVLQAVEALKATLSAEGIPVNDRTWGQCGKLLKARAWLDGLPEMDLEGMGALAHALWQAPSQRKTVQRAVYAVAAPLVLRAIESEDNAAELFAKVPKPEHPDYIATVINCGQQLKDIETTLHDTIRRSAARDKTRAVAALERITAQHATLTRQYQALMPSI